MISLPVLLTILVALLQLFWLLLQLASFRHKRASNTNREGISICIAARNEIAGLRNLIPALQKQNYAGPWEVIVALDRCMDGSAEYLKEQLKDFENLAFVEQSEAEVPQNESLKKHALLKAIEKSQYPLILQTDADCIPHSENWIQEMADSAENYNFVLGLSPYESGPGLLNQLIHFDTAWTAGSMVFFATQGNPCMSLGRNQLFRKSYFEANGGYGKGIRQAFGDDDLLIQHLKPGKKCKVCVTKSGRTVSIPETNWSDWLQQKLRHSLAGKYYKSGIAVLLGLNYLSVVFWILFIGILLTGQTMEEAVLWIFLIRSLLFSVLFYLLAQRSGSIVKWWLVPFLDLLHSIALVFNGFRALFTTKVEWR